jgi:hypothetical protein
MTEGEIVIDNDVILDGEGNLEVLGNFPADPVISVDPTAATELRGFAISRSDALEHYSRRDLVNQGTLTLANSTVNGIRNVAVVVGATATVANSLIDGGCGTGDITSNGYNIESPGDTCGFDQEGDQANVSAEALNLGPLTDNGGPTQTHALGAGSVAIDAIPEAMCEVDEDQRGEPRPGGTMCDVGPFEVQP